MLVALSLFLLQYKSRTARDTGPDGVSRPDPGSTSPPPLPQDFSEVRDAFTGMALDSSRGLYRCEECQVHYHADSFEYLTRENAGRCIACGSTRVVSISSAEATQQ